METWKQVLLVLSFFVLIYVWLIIQYPTQQHQQQQQQQKQRKEGLITVSESNTIVPIHGPFFLDTKNGFLLDLSCNIDAAQRTDNVNHKILNAVVLAAYERDGSLQPTDTYVLDATTKLLKPATDTKTEMVRNYTMFLATATKSNLQCINISWGNDTYVHVTDFSQTPPKLVATMLFPHNGTESQPVKTTTHTNDVVLQTSSFATEQFDRQFVRYNVYSTKNVVYQICAGIWIDTSNGSLVVKDNDSLSIYERKAPTTSGACEKPTPVTINAASTSTQPSYTPSTGPAVSLSFCTWSLVVGQRLVLYIANDHSTLVVVLRRDMETTQNQFAIVNMVRVLPNGTIDNGFPELNLAPNPRAPFIDAHFGNTGHHYYDQEDIDYVFHNRFDRPQTKNPFDDYYTTVTYFQNLHHRRQQQQQQQQRGSEDENILRIQRRRGLLDDDDDDIDVAIPALCEKCPYCQRGCEGVCAFCGGRGGAGTSLYQDNRTKSIQKKVRRDTDEKWKRRLYRALDAQEADLKSACKDDKDDKDEKEDKDDKDEKEKKEKKEKKGKKGKKDEEEKDRSGDSSGDDEQSAETEVAEAAEIAAAAEAAETAAAAEAAETAAAAETAETAETTTATATTATATTATATTATATTPTPTTNNPALSRDEVMNPRTLRLNVPNTAGADPYSYFGALQGRHDPNAPEPMPVASGISSFR